MKSTYPITSFERYQDRRLTAYVHLDLLADEVKSSPLSETIKMELLEINRKRRAELANNPKRFE